MLVLTRKKDQAIIIGDNIEITLLDIKGDQIKIGINAPKDIQILRKEVYLEIQAENEIALENKGINLESIAEMIKNNAASRNND